MNALLMESYRAEQRYGAEKGGLEKGGNGEGGGNGFNRMKMKSKRDEKDRENSDNR